MSCGSGRENFKGASSDILQVPVYKGFKTCPVDHRLREAPPCLLLFSGRGHDPLLIPTRTHAHLFVSAPLDVRCVVHYVSGCLGSLVYLLAFANCS